MSSNVQYNTISGADVIAQLPADRTQPSHTELQIVDTLFKKHGTEINSIVNESKDAILVGLIVIAISLPQVNEIIVKFIPAVKKSPYILIGLKALAAAAIYWLTKHFYLSRK